MNRYYITKKIISRPKPNVYKITFNDVDISILYNQTWYKKSKNIVLKVIGVFYVTHEKY